MRIQMKEFALALSFGSETEHTLNKRMMKPQKNTQISPLKIDGMKKVFIGLFIFYSIASIIFVLEIIVSMTRKYDEVRCKMSTHISITLK